MGIVNIFNATYCDKPTCSEKREKWKEDYATRSFIWILFCKTFSPFLLFYILTDCLPQHPYYLQNPEWYTVTSLLLWGVTPNRPLIIDWLYELFRGPAVLQGQCHTHVYNALLPTHMDSPHLRAFHTFLCVKASGAITWSLSIHYVVCVCVHIHHRSVSTSVHLCLFAW